jgi:hypothetical protein
MIVAQRRREPLGSEMGYDNSPRLFEISLLVSTSIPDAIMAMNLPGVPGYH